MHTGSNELLPISETMLIPLSARAAETGRDNPVISDKKSVEIISKIDTVNKVIDGGKVSTHGILARTKVIDDELKKSWLKIRMLPLSISEQGWIRVYAGWITES